MNRKTIGGLCGAMLAAVAGGLSHAQLALYSNGSATPSEPGLSTGATSASGAAAPAGSLWSEVPRTVAGDANAIAGFSCEATASGVYRLADDVVISDSGGWLIESVSFFAYQPDAPSSLSPFSTLSVRIWQGRPGEVGSVVVFGDTTTNRLTASSSTETYRIFASTATPVPQAAEPDRLIWKLDATTLTGGHRLLLKRGSYWIDWQIASANAGGEVLCPPVTGAGTRGSGNARQFQSVGAGSAWMDAVDPGKPMSAADVVQALPFLVRGVQHCVADVDDGSGTGNPDEGVDVNDLLFYLAAFEAGSLPADVDDGSNTGTPDQGVDINDLLYFLARFEVGC